MKTVLLLVMLAGVFGCGVKGDPVAPGTPAELGRGQPTYKKATEEFAFPDIPPIYDDENKKEESGK